MFKDGRDGATGAANAILQVVIFLFALYLTSFYNFDLFHSLAELFTVSVAFGIFTVVWNSRRYIDNHYFLLIGISFLFVGVLDVIHTLAYKGMGVFFDNGGNLPTQFWLAARYLQTVSFLIAPLYVSRKVKPTFVFYAYLIATLAIFLSIFYWKNFPAAYIEGKGLTQFKVFSEYLIVGVLLIDLMLLYLFRKGFSKRVLVFLEFSFVTEIVSEIFFTKYFSVFSLANLTGHFFKVISFYLLYLGITETILTRPFQTLFKNLKDSENALRASEERYRGLVEFSPEAILLHKDRNITYVNPAAMALLDAKDPKELIGKDIIDFFHPDYREVVIERIGQVNNGIQAKLSEFKMKTLSDKEIYVESLGRRITEANESLIFSIVRDITERKKTQDELTEKQLFIERLVNTSPNIIYIYDLFERRTIFINREITESLGYKEEQIRLMGAGFLQELTHPEDYPKIQEHYRSFLSAPEGAKRELEYRMKCVDGEWRWLSCVETVFLKTGSGITKQVIGSLMDVTDKKKADIELQEIKETLQLALDTYPDPFVIYDSNRKFTFVNNSAANLTGIPKEEFIGKTDEMVYGENFFKPFLSVLLEAIQTKTKQSQECIISMPSGNLIYNVTYVPLLSKSGIIKQIIGITHDITERSKAEEAIRESEERYRSIVELSPDTLIIHYFGEIIYVNAAGLHLLGAKSSDEVIGKEIWDFFHPSYREFIKSRITQFKEGQTDVPLKEALLVTLDGRTIDVEIKGVSINYFGKPAIQSIIRDISKRKLVIDDASDHVVITDPEGKIVYANHAAEKMTGFSREEMMGKTSLLWGNCIDKDLHQEIKYCIRAWDMINEKNPSFMGEVVNQKKNGEKYIADLHISPVFEDGEIVFFIAIERDITRLKEIDRAKTEFVSLASHQLRTPLSSISLSTELLLRGIAGQIDPEQKKYILEIYKAAKKMTELINALLNISRLELGTFTIKPESIDPLFEINQIVDSLNLQMKEKDLNLEKDYQDNLPDIIFDKNILIMIVENLLSNAVRYTPRGGKISVGMKKENDNILIKVSDTGCGIPKNQQRKIFSKLFRADNAQAINSDGAGLGLYIVKSLIKQTGSKIWFESEEGKGTTFYVSIKISNS